MLWLSVACSNWSICEEACTIYSFPLSALQAAWSTHSCEWIADSRCACLQSLHKDNELEAYVILAQLCNNGWLPVQQILPTKSVRAWLKEYQPDAAQHPAESLQVLLLKLQEQSTDKGTLQLPVDMCIPNTQVISDMIAAIL